MVLLNFKDLLVHNVLIVEKSAEVTLEQETFGESKEQMNSGIQWECLVFLPEQKKAIKC